MDRNETKELEEIPELSSEKVAHGTERFNNRTTLNAAAASSSSTGSHYRLIGSDSAFLSPWTSETHPISMPLPIGLATAESRTEQKDSQIQDDEKFAKKKMEDDFDVGCKCDYHRDKSQNDSPTLGLHSASNRPDTLKNDGNDKNLIQESALSLAIESIKVPSNSETSIELDDDKKEPPESLSTLGASVKKYVKSEAEVDKEESKLQDEEVPQKNNQNACEWCDQPDDETTDCPLLPSTSLFWHQIGIHDLPNNQSVFPMIILSKSSLPQTSAVESQIESPKGHLDAQEEEPRESWIIEQPPIQHEESSKAPLIASEENPRESWIIEQPPIHHKELSVESLVESIKTSSIFDEKVRDAKIIEQQPTQQEEPLDRVTFMRSSPKVRTEETEKNQSEPHHDQVDCHITSPSFVSLHHDIEDLPPSLQPVISVYTMTSVTFLDPLKPSKNDDDDGYQNLQRAESGAIGGVASSAWIDENASFVTEKTSSCYERAPLGGRMQPKIENLECITITPKTTR